MSQYAFYFNADKCITCKACVIACKDKYDLKPGRKFRRLYSVSTGSWARDVNGVYAPESVFGYSVSISCNHCAKPACKDICPAGAIGKRGDGIVFIDRDLCIGCGSCSTACPYGAPSLDKDTLKMDKCDFCRELVSIGEIPACVGSCSMQALEFGEIDTLRVKHPDVVQTVPPLADPAKTDPSLLITPHSKSAGSMTVEIFNMPEELQANEA